MNLLKETVEAIADSGHSEEDISFIGSEKSGHSCTWAEFKAIADREYDSGYGASEVAEDLIIVFGDGMKMWRGEYDGSEWWNYSTPFKMPEKKLEMKHLFADQEPEASCGWNSLADLNVL